ncbi:(Fe-S)-binding protein [Aliidiomarina sedimenti]|uniref:(Fe-S)-binding protein n=2 Tax=Aliidiomarina TaxID=1249554 RepID=A0A432WMN0_9GAMM|nr:MULTISPECIES: class I ribonucleotide reductase maintenance protein YfaE [Aliidiomarina]RUO31701.1 (Fe-S)-binding protein [Aliidiomarina sedimenti]RUO35035.1 (Fe-S)-binding protein [Aliidiomarina soli]
MSKPLRVKVNGEPLFEVPAQNKDSLLQSMEQAGLETHFHCRNGFCGACRSHLISGQVAYITEPLAYVRPGDILPCVCIATSDLELEH